MDGVKLSDIQRSIVWLELKEKEFGMDQHPLIRE
jgi:hypothetical protein